MKRASTRFWLCASVILCGFLGILGTTTYSQDQKPISGRRINEYTLAGLRPGRSTLEHARDLFRAGFFTHPSAGISSLASPCNNQEMEINTGAGVVVDSVRIQTNEPAIDTAKYHCGKNGGWHWSTGKGLRIGNVKARVVAIYGEPNSVSPSTKNGQPLELLYYAFDWAGSDVPQVMEVVCTVPKDGTPGRVVEITLAASSL